MPKEDIAQKPQEISKSPSTSQNASPQIPRTKTDYVEMAKERNARVILHNTPDTYPLTDLARYADQSIRRLRNRIMISISPEEALPLLDDYNEALVKLHQVIEKICAITNVRSRSPRGLGQLLEEKSAEPENEVLGKAENTLGSNKQ